ncbi:hypothetical protein HQ489_00775 [Candidatus Woesearchaeota archaeon]|nr:hypothetical protein [Candidatus Woesearchaeota archaeon]
MELSQLFEKQQEFCNLINSHVEKIRPEKTDHSEFNILINKLREEVEEVRAEFDNRENLKEELVDVMKFIVNICLLKNITAEEFFQSFMDKSDKNVQRFLEGDWSQRWEEKDKINEKKFG